MVHLSQGLTMHNPQKWSNLSYLAVSRVEYIQQLERVICPMEEGSGEKLPISGEELVKSRSATSDKTKMMGARGFTW